MAARSTLIPKGKFNWRQCWTLWYKDKCC